MGIYKFARMQLNGEAGLIKELARRNNGMLSSVLAVFRNMLVGMC